MSGLYAAYLVLSITGSGAVALDHGVAGPTARAEALDESEDLAVGELGVVGYVEIVADRKGIDTVYRFIPTSEPFEAENPEQAMMAIRLRDALRYPEELDITTDVMEELHLEEE